MTEQADATQLQVVVHPFLDEPVGRRLKIRLRELGDDCRDEWKQFHILQRACREDAALDDAVARAGFSRPTALSRTKPSPELGRLVQAFNLFVETHLEDH